MAASSHAATAAPATPIGRRQWYIVSRWQEFEGEARANLLRIAAVGAFYTVELVQHYLVLDGEARAAAADFHRTITLLSVGWTMLSIAVLLCLQQRIYHGGLKYLSTTCDLSFLTGMAAQANMPTQTPLVYAFFPIVVLSGLRLNVGLVWYAALGAMAGYMLLVGKADPVWFDADHTTPIVTQLLMLLSLGTTGVLLGQIVRRVRAVANDFAERLEAAGKVTQDAPPAE